MIWLFERNGDQLEYEIRHEQRQQPFDVVIRLADRQKVEHLADPSDLLRYSAAIWAQLFARGWRPVLPPTWTNRCAD